MDVLVKCCLLTLALPPVTIGFKVDGQIVMENTTDLASTAPGDAVIFSFDTQLELEDNIGLFVSISGDTLEFYNQTYVQTVDWTLDDGMGTIIMKNETNLDLMEDIYIPLNNQGRLAYMLNVSGGLGAGQWSFNGSYQMTVTDDITLGSLIRSVITIMVVWTPYNSSTRTLVSDYYVIPPPEVVGTARSSLTQPIMGLFKSDVIIRSPRDIGDCHVSCHTTPENISKEVSLTVQELKVLTNETNGTTPDTLDRLKDVTGYKLSTLGSYQNNLGIMNLPRIPLDDLNSTELTVVSELTFRVEDYSQLQSGDRWPVNMGVSFSGNLLWAGWIEVNITAPTVSMPALSVTAKQTGQCAYDGSTTASLQVLVSHHTSSTGTAYNVTVNLYLPDYMTMKRKTFTEPRENKITVKQDGTVITSEITRLTFSDPFTLDVTLTLNLSSYQLLAAANRIVTVEAMCNDRWGNATDILTETAYVSLKISKVCAKHLTWASTTSKCTCLHDPGRADCGCCLLGACQCGAVLPYACAPCDQMWRCMPFKSGYERISNLWSKSIRCDAYQRRRGSATSSSCFKTLSSSPVQYLEISPRVAVITGTDNDSGYLYGVANNGLAYVISKDGGTTWNTIFDDVYENAIRSSEFKWALVSS